MRGNINMNQNNHPLYQQLSEGLTKLSLNIEHAHKLLDYLDLLVRWNKAYNLTAIRDPNEMLTKHLLDSLAMHPYFTQANLADLGTGAGLPGIPLAIIRPEAQITLIESNGKKREQDPSYFGMYGAQGVWHARNF